MVETEHLAVQVELDRYNVNAPGQLQEVSVGRVGSQCLHDAPELPPMDRLLWHFDVEGRARLDLNCDELAFVHQHQVDLAKRNAVVAREQLRTQFNQVVLSQPFPIPADSLTVQAHAIGILAD